MKYNLDIYILSLKDGFYYVGRSQDIDSRLKTHFKHKGARWTKLHKPTKILDVIPFEVSSKDEEDKWENHVTIKTMKRYGWQNVRGGFWCNCADYETLKGLQAHCYFTDETVGDCVFSDRHYYIYTLELADNCLYVGFTKSAIKKLEKGKASKWVEMHNPISIIDIRKTTCETGVMDIKVVDDVVIAAFEKYGYANVRGGSYVATDPEVHRKKVKSRLGITY